MVAVADIPQNLRVPLASFQINPSQAVFQSSNRCLLVGHKSATGTLANDTATLVNDNIDQLAGANSVLAAMYRAARDNAPLQEIWVASVAEGAGAASTATITVAGAPLTAAGTVYFYLNGERYSVAVTTTDTDTDIAANIVAEINANVYTPVTAANAAGVVTLTSDFTGVISDDMVLELDRVGDEGVTSATLLTVVAFTGGAGTADVSGLLANLGDEEFDVIGMPFNDATNLDATQDFMDGTSGRWSYAKELYGHVITAKNGTYAVLSAFGNTRNDPHASIMPVYNSGSPIFDWVGALAGATAAHFNGIGTNLSVPMHATTLKGIKAPKLIADRWDLTERQSMYFDGLCGYRVDKAGNVIIDRMNTTYQLNDWGLADPSWLNVNTMFQSMGVARFLKAEVTGAYSQVALAETDPLNRDNVATVDEVRATVLHAYAKLCDLSICENYALFESLLTMERSVTDPDRIDAVLPPDMVNQFRVFAAQMITHQQLGNFNS